MAGWRIGLLGLAAAALAVQIGVIAWRGSAHVRSDAGLGGDLRLALMWTLLAFAVGLWAERRGAPALALWLGAAFAILFAALLWLQALAGKPPL
ncbi:MAG TPA: hypothetical protein VGK29_27855 [Paludibaculum sp.]